jgi:dihydropteroate synthase
MGVVNTTPDSFSDGGKLYKADKLDLDQALARCEAMVAAGAAILDIGGESTRPGAKAVSVQEELDRVVPLVERITQNVDVAVSLDTSTPQVMQAGASVGAHIVNDVRALRRDGALAAAASTDLAVCLMHMQGEPGSMQHAPTYDSVVDEVTLFLQERVAVCTRAGIDIDRLWIDPGFGFGKTLSHNMKLMCAIDRFVATNLPVLVGVSRKSMIGAITGRDVSERLAGGLSFATWALLQGAQIIRTHDVAETVDVVAVVQALREENG